MAFEKSTWRLIKSPPLPGALNMAIDEAILEAAGRGTVPPTLRLYSWKPACLSLGYAQPISDVNRAQLAANHWDLVRRPTGGRAILHADELTYSVAGPLNEPRLAGDILSSYRRLAQALLAALMQLSLPVQAMQKEKGEKSAEPEPICFEVPSSYEITVNGKKLVGSAQTRRKDGVLQHGTLPLHGDLTRITQALAFPNEASQVRAAERLLERAATVELALNRVVTWEEAAQAFARAFREILHLEFHPATLTAAEQTRAEQLLQEKYSNSEWTEKL